MICGTIHFADDSVKRGTSYWTLRRRAKSTIHAWENVQETSDDSSESVVVEELSSAAAVYASVEKFEASRLCSDSGSSQLSSEVNSGHLDEHAHDYDYDVEDGEVLHEYSDSDGEASDSVEEHSLALRLSHWVASDKVQNSSVDRLLRVLHDFHPDLPLTYRTLMNTGAHQIAVSKIEGGEYAHFGILNGVRSVESQVLRLGVEVVHYQINIDGLPLFRSSLLQLWPILGMVVGTSSPFLIGAFCGSSKPPNIEQFLQQFITEALELNDDGFFLQGVRFRAEITCFICDAPARALIKATKLHCGYYGCDRCLQKGEYVQGRVTFPALSYEKRTDEQFAKGEYSDHQKNLSPLVELNIGLVSCCVLDYMHLVCLGVMRRMIFFWLKGPLKIRLSARHVSLISNTLVSFRGNVPLEFARKPRSLSEVECWKAAEFRQFLLYSGIVALKSHMQSKLYEHFVCLSVAMHILLSPTLCHHYCDYVEELLRVWVKDSMTLYGKQFAVYNVHSVLHLSDDVRKFGNLDNVSAFPFENFMRTLKTSVRKPQHVLQQLGNRMSEGRLTVVKTRQSVCDVKVEHTDGAVVSGLLHCKQYRELQSNSFTVKLNSADSCIMYGKSIGLVSNIFSDGETVTVIALKFKRMKHLFSKPLRSTDIGIYVVSKLSSQFDLCPLSEIHCKYVLLPYHRDSKWVAIPLIHSF